MVSNLNVIQTCTCAHQEVWGCFVIVLWCRPMCIFLFNVVRKKGVNEPISSYTRWFKLLDITWHSVEAPPLHKFYTCLCFSSYMHPCFRSRWVSLKMVKNNLFWVKVLKNEDCDHVFYMGFTARPCMRIRLVKCMTFKNWNVFFVRCRTLCYWDSESAFGGTKLSHSACKVNKLTSQSISPCVALELAFH